MKQVQSKKQTTLKKKTLRWMASTSLLVLGTGLVLGKADFKSTSGVYHHELSCLEKLTRYSELNGAMLNSSVGVVVGSRAFDTDYHDEGLIAFDQNQAYFLLLPKPVTKNQQTHYYLELRLPQHQAIYLSYTVEPRGENPSKHWFIADSSPSPEIKNHYVLLKGEAIDSPQAIEQIQSSLALGAAGIQKKLDLHWALHQMHPHHFKSPVKQDYQSSLATCETINHRPLQAQLKTQAVKLAKIPEHGSFFQKLQSTLGFTEIF